MEKSFADYSLLLHQRTPFSQILWRKLSWNCHKTAKFAKVFFLESFPLYGSHWTSNLESTGLLGTYFVASFTKLIASVQDFSSLLTVCKNRKKLWGRKLLQISRFCGYSRKFSLWNLGGVVSFGTAQVSNPLKFSPWKSYFSPICESLSFLPWKSSTVR